MTCADFEDHIALDAGGDLPEVHREALEKHLQTCDGCRGLAAALAATQADLGELGRQSIDAISAARVRRRVQESIAQEADVSPLPQTQRPIWHWAAAALLILGLGLSVGPFQRPAEDRPSAPGLVVERTLPWKDSATDPSSHLVLANVQPPAIERTASHKRSSARPKPATPPFAASIVKAPEPAPESEPEPMVIQLVSDDNSVVIHWLVAATS